MSKKKPALITNTAGQHPGIVLPGFPIGLADNGRSILAQEARGTREVASASGTRLPVEGTSTLEDQDRCHAVGIRLGPKVPGDPIFREAQLPEGWTTQPSREDSRTTNIVDANGHVRGYIWYKAASYDRRAYLRILARYWPEPSYTNPHSRMCYIVKDRADGKAIWTSQTLERPKPGTDKPSAWQAYEEAQNGCARAASEWLDKTFPDWKNPGAYWP